MVEKNQILEIAEKLQPYGSSVKVKEHLNILANMIVDIHKDGFELMIGDDLTINDKGDAGRISILLTSANVPDMEVPLIEENFDTGDSYVDNYPDEESVKDAYSKAKESALNIIHRKTEPPQEMRPAA